MHELIHRYIKWNETRIDKFTYQIFNDEVILPYMKERAEWLKAKKPTFSTLLHEHIDQAFGVEKKSLEDKLLEVSNSMNPYRWAKMSDIARQHFRDNPQELEG